jgi:hypothetical protein
VVAGSFARTKLGRACAVTRCHVDFVSSTNTFSPRTIENTGLP